MVSIFQWPLQDLNEGKGKGEMSHGEGAAVAGGESLIAPTQLPPTPLSTTGVSPSWQDEESGAQPTQNKSQVGPPRQEMLLGRRGVLTLGLYL